MALAIAKGFISTKTIKNGNIIVSARTEKTLEVWKVLYLCLNLNEICLHVVIFLSGRKCLSLHYNFIY